MRAQPAGHPTTSINGPYSLVIVLQHFVPQLIAKTIPHLPIPIPRPLRPQDCALVRPTAISRIANFNYPHLLTPGASMELMDSALVIHRLHFAFTVTFHYIFPQLTMGLALLILILKTIAWRRRDQHYERAAAFWIRIFGVNFALGVVTGIPMEFQFGTNWSSFAKAAGGVIGQTLAMEGVFSFFLESTFLGLLVYGAKRLPPALHWFSALMVFLGSWLSGFFIIATDAWMQHPVGYRIAPDGQIVLTSFATLLGNPWIYWQYAHNMTGAVVTASFVMAALGAFYLLNDRFTAYALTFLRTGVIAGCIATLLMIFPTGDRQGHMIAESQPVTLAGMEGHFETMQGAPIALVGQPDMQRLALDNPILVPRMLSILTYQHWAAEVKGLKDFPPDQWPDNIPLLYYSYHIMVGLGTLMVALMLLSAFLLWRRKLFEHRAVLWTLMLAFPFPYIATTFGWMTAELGRQPWLIYGLMRTSQGVSAHVSAGNGLFTLLGFMGLYAILTILFLFLIAREVNHGPENPALAGGH
jgi:cytochrome d ubiquinol oxidase subunit I